MREKIKKMNIILNYFNYKYNGNWEMVYSVIKNRTNVNVIELEKFLKEKMGKLKDIGWEITTIIDEKYPENFKSIYMPPITIFSKGNKQLMFDKNITSVWGKIDVNDFVKDMNKNFVYSMSMKDTNTSADDIKTLLKNGFKIILIESVDEKNSGEKDRITNKNLVKLSEDYPENLMLFSEISPLTKTASIESEQTYQRNVLGSSNEILFMEKSDDLIIKNTPLFKFENKKLSFKNIKTIDNNTLKVLNKMGLDFKQSNSVISKSKSKALENISKENNRNINNQVQNSRKTTSRKN